MITSLEQANESVKHLYEMIADYRDITISMKEIDNAQTAKESQMAAWDTPRSQGETLAKEIKKLNDGWLLGNDTKIGLKEKIVPLHREIMDYKESQKKDAD